MYAHVSKENTPFEGFWHTPQRRVGTVAANTSTSYLLRRGWEDLSRASTSGSATPPNHPAPAASPQYPPLPPPLPSPALSLSSPPVPPLLAFSDGGGRGGLTASLSPPAGSAAVMRTSCSSVSRCLGGSWRCSCRTARRLHRVIISRGARPRATRGSDAEACVSNVIPSLFFTKSAFSVGKNKEVGRNVSKYL